MVFKKISCFFVFSLCLLCSGLALADIADSSNNSGLYFGAQFGSFLTPSDINLVNELVYSKMKDSGFSVHANIGYAFNPYFGLEVGEQYVPRYTFIVNSFDEKPSGIKENFQKNYVDLSLKAIARIGNFGLFIKPGVAWAHQSNITVKYPDGTTNEILPNKNELVPLLGLGALYHINDHVAVDLSATNYFKSKNIESVIFGGAGLTYYL